MSIPVGSTQTSSAPAEIPLWYFDETNGVWKEEGKATLQGNEYVGEVSHFTFWNCDISWDLIYLDGSVLLEGVNLEGAYVCLSFENNGWEIIDSAQPAHNEPPPLCYSSTWLSMNVLVLDPKTVCVEKSEVYQAEQLDKLGMEVIPVEMRDAYAFGGGLHCCTADVYREGELKDYFPKQ